MIDWKAVRSGTLQQRYNRWRRSPDGQTVIDAVIAAALRLKRRGYSHYGIAALFEGARYTYALRVGPDAEGFKLNNSWRSRLAREIMRDVPELEGFFELRELKT